MPFPRAARSCLALFVLLACPLAVSAVHAKPAARNLLRNPGFEQPLVIGVGDSTYEHPWMPAAWDTTVSGLPTVFFGRDSLLAHGGSFSVSLANLSVLFPMGNNWSQSLLVGREAWGKDLVFSVWTRSNALNGRAYILLQAYRDTISKMAITWHVGREEAAHRMNIKGLDDPLIDLGWKREFFSQPETEWVRREVRVYCPPSVNVVFVRCGIQGTGQVMLDDASLTIENPLPVKAPAVGENLLADPGFEGDGNGWELSLPPYRGMRIDAESTVVHSGQKAVLCTSGEGEFVKARSGPCQALFNRALQGKRLRLTAWAKTDSLRSSPYLKIYCHTMRGMRQVPFGQMIGSSSDWTKMLVEMDVPTDTYGVWVWLAWDAPVAGRLYWDDARLEVVGPAKNPEAPERKR